MPARSSGRAARVPERRQRHLGGEVDPTRPLRERALQNLDPVRRHHERDVRVATESVEGFEHLEQ